jgi:hypothetical protein
MNGARAIRRYGLWFFLPLACLSLLLTARSRWPAPDATGELRARLAAYLDRPTDHDLLFLGDSRTYCGLHPDRLDPLLGTRSLNLARWAQWFPTQYPFLQDLLPVVPAGTTIVWSIGHQNFIPIDETVNTAYPVGAGNLPRYLHDGFSLQELRRNLMVWSPLTQVPGRGEQWRAQLDAVLAQEAWRPSPPAVAPVTPIAPVATATAPAPAPAPALDPGLEATRRWEADAETARVEQVVADGRVTSLAVHRRRGSYLRVELVPEFFRTKQAEAAEAAKKTPPAAFELHPAYWALFLDTLELLRASGHRVIVNELEEAPYTYGSPAARASCRRFMDEVVRPEVAARGFAWVRADLDRLRDEHYFDWNHLNAEGVAVYSPLLAEALRPHLAPRRRD